MTFYTNQISNGKGCDSQIFCRHQVNQESANQRSDYQFVVEQLRAVLYGFTYSEIEKGLPELEIRQMNGNPFVGFSSNLFTTYNHINGNAGTIIKDVVEKYGGLSNEEIKTKVYLTTRVRNFLKLEKQAHLNLYNVPIQF